MVADLLSNASQYQGFGPRIARAFEFISRTDLHTLPAGTHPIDGDDVFVIVNEYQTKPVEECRWEAHRRYIDIQCMLLGTERMGVGNVTRFRHEPYDAERDVLWLHGGGDLLTLHAGSFMIFWPQDAHMPGVMLNEPGTVLKAVVKVAVGD